MKLRLGLIGAGNIGTVIAKDAKDYSVVCVYDLDEEKGRKFAKRFSCRFLKVEDFPKLDLVVEAASQQAVGQYGESVLSRGYNLMIMSVGALSNQRLLNSLLKTAEKKKAKIILPSGAITGLDGLKSASIGRIDEVTLTTTKNPKSLPKGKRVSKKILLFDGPAREAVKRYPKNVNVSATLSLAGIGFDKTRVRIFADPGVDRNIHQIQVKGEFGEFETTVRNLPFPDKPSTSYLAALSAVAAIREFGKTLVV
jgi:aspartate dehydrogenase